ncbi:hypothetical protein N7495_001867 [Penicillium taxi]|uniref:uncharacterized protein n=1 Tax=Penicillium taxi TaxID=168475 RepID=UPI002545335D|nr:uncharacterized protein N7495_001867 [Penicillium taxi]KAJ5909185.1 hypothetical protein N7495_001867 [Penicillium taxi]
MDPPIQRSNDPSTDEPLAGQAEVNHRRSFRYPIPHADEQTSTSPDGSPAFISRQTSHQHQVEPFSLDGTKPHHRYKHSKPRLPRHMSHLTSSASARGLLPTWSGREKDREGDDRLLRPNIRGTPQSRWGSDSTTEAGAGTDSRKGSLLDNFELYGPIRAREILSPEDLEQVKKRRKQGEEYLRSTLSSIGTQATDITRRLDYTYYNLLEKMTALNTTIASFQDLSDSAAKLLSNFERETAELDQGVQKQIQDLQGFKPQIQKADALEKRMILGRQRVEELGKRLEKDQQEIDRWERRESEWQSRTSRRLRIFWALVASSVLVLLLALVLPRSPEISLSNDEAPISIPIPTPTSVLNLLSSSAHPPDVWGPVLGVGASGEPRSWYSSSLEVHQEGLEQTTSSVAIAVHSHRPP